jgi:poly-gamma-glutamate synthesis protein (capsule biosynthesis protein)
MKVSSWPFFVFAGSLIPVFVLAGFIQSPVKGAKKRVVFQDTLVADTCSITFSFIGDLMCHSPQFNNARQPNGSYDFTPSFAEIAPHLSWADFTIGNLETTCAGTKRVYGGYPAFNTPDEFITAIKNAGVDFLVTSNNHSMDTGEEGLLRTIDVIKKNNLGYCGTYDSQRDRDSIRVLRKNGIATAVLNYTYGTNGAYPIESHKYMLNVADSALVTSDIKRAREMGCDIIIVFYHWGEENKAEPTAYQRTMAKWAREAGADLVIGAHPHVIGPMDYFSPAAGSKLDSGLIAWSLGNFISNQYWRYTDAGVILNVRVTKRSNGKMKLASTKYIPTWVYRAYDPGLKQHVVVPAKWCSDTTARVYTAGTSKMKMCEARTDTRLILTKNIAVPEDSIMGK